MMFRLPVLTGAAGALGATYCSPYLTVDGAYHGRPSRQASCLGSSRLLANCHCLGCPNVLLNFFIGSFYPCLLIFPQKSLLNNSFLLHELFVIQKKRH